MTRKRIGFDLRCLPSDGTSGAGIPHAARELWQACLEEAPAFSVDLVAFVADRAKIEEKDGTVVRLLTARSQALRAALRQQPIDLLFCPSGTVPFGLSLPTVPWIHDLAIFTHPEWFPEPFWQRWLTTSLVRRGVYRAPIVMTVSAATKAEVVQQFRLEAERIVVTGQGVAPLLQPGSLPKELCQQPYALLLGTVEPRKNIRFIQTLWPDAQVFLPEDVLLVIAGRDGWGERFRITDPSMKRFTDVNEETRIALLQGASVVLVPSLTEGFGRVAAEALALGIPVIASDRGALPEVIRDFGQCLPLETDRWVKAIKDTIKPGPIRQYWQEQAHRAQGVFSWQPVAQTVLANLCKNC